MPYVRPVGQGVNTITSIAHQPLALPRTKHRPRREGQNHNHNVTHGDASSSTSSVESLPTIDVDTVVVKDDQLLLPIPAMEPEVEVEHDSNCTPMPDFGSMIIPNPSLLPVSDDLPTPRAGSTPPLSIPHLTPAPVQPHQTETDVDANVVLASRLASTSLDSEIAPSLSSSAYQSPASTSITSLSDQDQRLDPDPFDNDIDDEEEENGREGEGEGEVSPPTSISGGAGAGTPSIVSTLQLNLNSPEMDAIARYRQGLVAYTKSLYIQAQLTNSREEKKRLSTGYGSQFGIKPSGMQKIAERKALARRLNG